MIEVPLERGINWRLPTPISRPSPRPAIAPTELLQKSLLANYVPASVLINRKFEVLCFHGPTVNYLEFPSGEPTHDLLTLARQGLRTRLRTWSARQRPSALRQRRQYPSAPPRCVRAVSDFRQTGRGCQGSGAICSWLSSRTARAGGGR